MKTIKLLSIFILASLLFVSCEDQENVMYDNVNGKVLTSFVGSSASIAVRSDQVSSATVNVEVSTVSNVDRIVNFTIGSGTTATPDQYSVSDFVIPAGAYTGSATVTGNFDALPSLGSVTVQLNLEGINGVDAALGDTSFSISMERFCPFDINDFIGTYDAVEESGSGTFTYTVTATAGPAPNTLTLTDIYQAGGQATIELDASDPSSPTVINRSFEFDTFIFISGTWGNVYAQEYGDSTPSTFNVCAKTINFNFYRRIPDGRRFSGEFSVSMSKQ